MSETILKQEEKTAFALRSLYQKYGYRSYKMSKFEEYDLYVKNKEFLVGDGVITFNDTDGKLLALKPDVTLSIIKNDGDDGEKRKVCYQENVYRISEKTKQFKEIMQVGLECIGEIGLYDVYETLYLSAGSLATISPQFVLDISHLGILSGVLEEIGKGEEFSRKVMGLIAEKNAHELKKLCQAAQIAKESMEKLLCLVGAYGEAKEVIQKLAPICQTGKMQEALHELTALCDLLSETEYADKIRIDFSVINDMNYYSDIVFKGFIDGIGEGVLSGGRYDKLLSRMGRKSGGIGFAVNLDLLEGFQEERLEKDVDVLLVYGDDTDVKEVIQTTQTLIKQGKTVRAQTTEAGLRYGERIDLTGGKV